MCTAAVVETTTLPIPVRVSSRQIAHEAGVLEGAPLASSAGRLDETNFSSHVAAFLRDPSVRWRCGPSVCADHAWTCRHFDDANLHACRSGTVKRSACDILSATGRSEAQAT